MEGARAVAEAVALSRPEVICAYPNTPQTHIVEALGAKVKAGTLRRCEFLNVESESADLRMALAGQLAPGRSGEPVISTVIAGLGGRAITQASVRNMLTDAAAGALEPLSFLDLKKDLVKREFLRIQRSRRSGPNAENMLRDHGTAHAH